MRSETPITNEETRLWGLELRLTCLALVAGLWALPSPGAVYEHRRVSLDLEAGSYLRTEDMRVRLDRESDLEAWDRYSIYLDEHIELEEARAEVLDADGKVLARVPRRQFESFDSPGSGLYSSGQLKVIPFSGLRVGQQIRLRLVKRVRPLFPASSVQLVASQEQLRLQVRVRGGGESLRWHLRGDEEVFRVRRTAEGLEVVGEGLEGFERGNLSPSFGAAAPTLLLSWDAGGSWASVGRWYQELTAEVPRDRVELKALALRLTQGLSSSREKVDALSAYVKSKVRYEAVEIGAGRLIPSPAGDVMNRGWGDCKDKAELLVGLLEGIDVPSHLALLRAGSSERIETDFPSPYQFNHAIVAVAAEAVTPHAGDPVSEGLLFVDPTSAWGKLGWLHSASQGHHALVVDRDRSRLVRTPEQPAAEANRLEVQGTVDGLGNLTGTLTLRLDGTRAIPWIRDVGLRPQEATLDDFLDIVHQVAPGAELVGAGWQVLEQAVPGIVLRGEIRLDAAVRGEAGRRWLRATALQPLPAPGLLDHRTQPVVLRTGGSMTRWRLQLPDGWCPAAFSEEEVANAVGRFSRKVSSPSSGVVEIEQAVAVARSWVEAGEFSALHELALAETRASRRRIRLRCPEAGEAPATASGAAI